MKITMINASDRCYFLGPEPDSFRSGGNLYNSHLFHALEVAGWECKPVASSDEIPVSGTSPVIIDSLELEQLISMDPEKKRRCFPLIHHLPGMESGHIDQGNKESRALDQVGGIIANSAFTRDYIERIGINDVPVIVLSPCMVIETLERNRTFEFPLTLLLAGNIIPRKGVLQLLEQFAHYRPPAGRVRLVIAGGESNNPVYSMRCRSLVQSDNYLESLVHWTGNLTPKEMPNLYARSDILIAASSMESFGMAVMESIAAGLPVLALENGNLPNLIQQGKHGKIFPDAEKLVRFIKKKVTEKPEQFLAWLEKVSARKYMPPRTWEDHALELTEFFHKNLVHAK